MNKEEIRKYISCPQFGDNHYGKWGALKLEQRLCIKTLLEVNKDLEQENKQLKEKLNKIENLIADHNYTVGDIYFKYDGKYLKSEFKKDLLEILKGEDNE